MIALGLQIAVVGGLLLFLAYITDAHLAAIRVSLDDILKELKKR